MTLASSDKKLESGELQACRRNSPKCTKSDIKFQKFSRSNASVSFSLGVCPKTRSTGGGEEKVEKGTMRSIEVNRRVVGREGENDGKRNGRGWHLHDFAEFPAFSWVLSLWLSGWLVVSRVCRVSVRVINRSTSTNGALRCHIY